MRGHETITKKEYVEDQFLADSMFDEDKLARSQVEKKYLQQLQNEANDAYIKLLAAQEAYDIAMSKLKAEEAKQAKLVEDKQKSSPVKIYGALDITIPPMEKKQATKSKQAIAPQEMKAVEKHFENLPSHLQSLMEAVLGENITLGLARDPVFIRGEGIVYDRSTAEGWLKDKAEALLPHNPGKTFTKADIITCNTIIDAMADLMKIIQGKEAEMKAPASLAKLSYTDKSLSAKRVLISTDTIEKIEKAYASFPDKHKLLFNKICRDPITNIIMDDPVFLPDGYIYDRGTVTAALLNRPSAKCPLNKEISFALADITNCYCVRKALEQLQKMFEKPKEESSMKMAP